MDRVKIVFLIAVLCGVLISFSISSPIDNSINSYEPTGEVEDVTGQLAKFLPKTETPVDAPKDQVVEPTVDVNALADVAVQQPQEINSPVDAPKIQVEPTVDANASADAAVQQPQENNSPVDAPKIQVEPTVDVNASADAAVQQPQEINSPTEAPKAEPTDNNEAVAIVNQPEETISTSGNATELENPLETTTNFTSETFPTINAETEEIEEGKTVALSKLCYIFSLISE